MIFRILLIKIHILFIRGIPGDPDYETAFQGIPAVSIILIPGCSPGSVLKQVTNECGLPVYIKSVKHLGFVKYKQSVHSQPDALQDRTARHQSPSQKNIQELCYDRHRYNRLERSLENH